MTAKTKNSNTNKVVSIDHAKSTINTIEAPHKPNAEICPRDEKGRFLKGYSGNPHAWATRKLNTPLALLCRENVEKWASVLDSIIMSPEVEPMVKVSAIKLGFEYGYGKPLQGSEARSFEKSDYQNLIRYLQDKAEKEFGKLYLLKPKDEQKVRDFIASTLTNYDNLSRLYRDVFEYSILDF